MFRNPRPKNAGSTSGNDSPPSAKKPKLSNSTLKTPQLPKQSLLAPYTSGSRRKASTYLSSRGGDAKKKNTSILSFFRPVASGESNKKTPEEKDELFIRHGGYGLDVSEPEDEGEESDRESERGGWARGRSIPGELPLSMKEDSKETGSTTISTVEGSPIASPVNIRKHTLPPSPLDETLPPISQEPRTPARKPRAMTFDPSSIKLDRSKSLLFAKPGSTPSPFKKPKRQRAVSVSSESAEEVSFHAEEENLIIKSNNHNIGEFFTVDRVKNKTANETFWNYRDKRRKSEEIAIESSDDEVDDAYLDRTTIIPDAKMKDKDKEITEYDEFTSVGDFEEEQNFEIQEGFFDPASLAVKSGFEGLNPDLSDIEVIAKPRTPSEPVECLVCSVNLAGLSEADRNNHVNHCLDGNPIPLPPVPSSKFMSTGTSSPFFSNSTSSESSSGKPSVFKTLMHQNIERAQWTSAVNSEIASHGKRAEQRICPFYKILFSGTITVDAFRYGNVPGCNAYFLSHFHSDHYIGLTSKWTHGPIYCSRVTANLIRTKLGVDPQYIRELPWETWVEIEGTEGVEVRGLDANHCPGSMMFLFEKRKFKERVLHCGDFRAARKHLMHEFLRPRPKWWKEGLLEQRIDTMYLDTTYLNPKYAFPPQESVIDACAEMCISLGKDKVDMNDKFEGKRRKEGLGSFVKQETESKKRGRLLVVVGTYSIGKERFCLGIAKALQSKIYAPPAKMKLCECLEDGALNELLTGDPKEAQIHMTPLMDINPKTLYEYLNKFKPHFSRIVGFRPSGWDYKPPSSRIKDSPAVADVLHSPYWKSSYSTRELVPQRGSTKEARCFAVPYSEHSSFRELSMFCCGLKIGKIIPTVNIGSAKSRDAMRAWFGKWEAEKKKKGMFEAAEW